MPQFSVVAALLIRFFPPGPVTLIAYGRLPLYLRAVFRLTPVSELQLARFFSLLAGTVIEKIRHEGGVPDYPAINMRAMEAVIPVTLGLETELRQSRWIGLAGRLIGKEEAVAQGLQTIAYEWIWPQLLQIMVCAAALSPEQRLYIVSRPGWPARWNEMLATAGLSPGISFFVWPRWSAGIYRVVRVSGAIFTALALGLMAMARRGVHRNGAGRTPARLLCEFIDPAHLNGKPQDVDYLVDGQKLSPDELLLFVTEEQTRTLKASGQTRSSITSTISQKGYKHVWLDELPFPSRSIRVLVSTWLRTFACVFAPLPTADVFGDSWRGYLRFAPLFSHVQAKACLYLKIPNGLADGRRDTAILTGLCRQNGVISAGCQTRVVYGALYEFAFDCFDINFYWGSAWYRFMQPALSHVASKVDVGCPTLDLLVPLVAKIPARKAAAGRQVLIFTGDVAGSHYTFDYNVSFLAACLMLAGLHPDDSFFVKTKDPGQADRFQSDERLAPAFEESPHFEFIRRPRYDYAELLASADIVIAIGFTTPGTEALLLGKPAIYYSELRSGGEAYRSNPLWVAQTTEELTVAYGACRDPGRMPQDGRKELDPYCDGRARERILTTLFG